MPVFNYSLTMLQNNVLQVFSFPTFTVSIRCLFQNIWVRHFFFADVVYTLQDLWSTSMQTHSSSAKKSK